MQNKYFIILVVVLFLFITCLAKIYYSYPSTTYTYRFNCVGYGEVTITISNLTNYFSIPVLIDKYALRDTLVVTDEEGSLLPYDFVNETMLLAYTYNTTDTIVVSYTLNNFTIRNNVFEAIINPGSVASVVLPKDAGLIYFNGTAEVTVYDNFITLRYAVPGTYLIEYICETPLSPTSTSLPQVITTNYQSNPLNTLWPLFIGIVVVVLVILYILYRKTRGVEAVITTSEIDERDIEIMKALLEGKETISGLAKKLGISKSIIWRRTNKLAELGFIEKETRRGRTYLSLTEKGRKLVEKGETK